MERANPKKARGESLDATEMASLAKVWPELLAHLTDDKWDDGATRTVSTLLIFTEAGRWKVCLKDREAQMSLWASGNVLEDAVSALETCLALGTGEWKASGQKMGF